MSSPANDFWAITTYFNLTGGVKRLENYRCFRRGLSVPLLALEWNPQGIFHLRPSDADILIQIGGGDLMWQKERLLTIAASHLPAHAKYAAWIDCDVLFANPGWAEEARARLASASVIQLFSDVVFPDESTTASLRAARRPAPPKPGTFDAGAMPRRQSFLNLFARLKDGIVGFDLDRRFRPDEANSYNIMARPAYGFAWAALAAFFREMGVYDRCILGGGDMLFAYGMTGLSQPLIDNHNATGWSFYGDCPSYHAWAARAAEACAGQLSCVSGSLLHLFHGSLAARQYKSRIDGLVPFDLDLDRDIAAGNGEPWSWRRDREELNAYFLKYLRDRNEDG